VRLLDGNEALRYLWARHRIAVLGDYENLRHDDQRVKEITRLGLTYNLLTNYTSFVAVDSNVRREGGDVTTVQQPLPLPRGVSDLAVGSRNYAPAACAPVALEVGAVKQYISVMKAKARRWKIEEKPVMKAAKASVKVRDISWQGAELLSGEADWKAYLEDIRLCYAAFLKDHADVQGRLSLKLVIGPDGHVHSVSKVTGDLKQPDLETGIIARVKKWTFPAYSGKDDTTLILSLVLNS
jgi:Ca-activated chloride channel family protein